MFDGKDFGERMFDAVRSYLEREVAPLIARIETLERQIAERRDGVGVAEALQDADGCLVFTLTDGRICNVGEVRGEDGFDGKDGLDGKDGKDGESVVVEDLERLIDQMVAARVATKIADLPPAKDGRDGRDADPERVEQLISEKVAAAVAALPKPQDGRSVTPEELQPLIAEAVTRAVAALPQPASVVSQIIDRDGVLVHTLSDGQTREIGPVVGKDGKDGKDGAPGKDGASAADLIFDVLHDGERGFTIAVGVGDRVTEKTFQVPAAIYRGVYREGGKYERGDLVTWAGSLWHCEKDTDEKPGDGSECWRLAVKRGRDGKDGRDASPATKVKVEA